MTHIFRKQILVLAFFLSTFLAGAQQSEYNVGPESAFIKANKLYTEKAYAAAQNRFKSLSKQDNAPQEIKENSAYFAAICALELNQEDAEKQVLNFVQNYPQSAKKDLALLDLGNSHFNENELKEALDWYQKIKASKLSKEKQDELTFNRSYALMMTDELEDSKNGFSTLLSHPSYGKEASYYFGFIAYKQKDYTTAEVYLSEASKEQSYEGEASYYLLDISFKNAQFEKSVSLGKALLNKATEKDVSEVSKIVGESYFNLKRYKDAIPYLTAYKGKSGKWNNTDFYQLGYAYYQQKDYQNAVKNFTKIISSTDAVSQNAYYHLGECYLYLNQKSEALNAFKNASEMSFDAKIKEDAFLNYAKLSYEQGNPYKSVALVLQDFLAAYPQSPYYKEINTLVVTSYIYQQDYQGALDYMAKKRTMENIVLSKDVSFYRGVQLFNENKLKQAYSYFSTATSSTDLAIKAAAKYWKAETDYQLGNYKDALEGYISFKSDRNAKTLDEFAKVNYSIAYGYFKLKNYAKAISFFQEFLKTTNKSNALYDDANIRLGDCYFVTKNYQNAINAYQTVIQKKGVGADYAQYQKGMSFGFIGQNNTKITNLLAVASQYSSSNLQDDALFQTASTYALLKNNQKAHQTYNRLIKEHPKSSYIASALLRQGLLFYNDNQPDAALEKYKSIVKIYPATSEAKQAVSNARNVYVDLGQVDAYAAWVKNISFVNVTNADLDNTTYEAAENKFVANDNAKAIEGFEKYISSFPEGLHALQAHFYLAQSLLNTDNPEKASTHYQYVISKNQSEFSEEALNKLAQIYLENENWSAAMPLLSRLEQEANYAQNILFAQSNLMKGYYQDDQFKKATDYAEKVLQNDKLASNVEFDAKIIIARVAFKTDDLTTAENYYKEVEAKANGELKAEALYYSAYFKNTKKDYAGSNSIVQQLIADYSSYKYWGVKSYVIMAKNYYALKDAYQATYILENIIKNFSQYDDVIVEAQKELDRIKALEAKTNDSVNPKN